MQGWAELAVCRGAAEASGGGCGGGQGCVTHGDSAERGTRTLLRVSARDQGSRRTAGAPRRAGRCSSDEASVGCKQRIGGRTGGHKGRHCPRNRAASAGFRGKAGPRNLTKVCVRSPFACAPVRTPKMGDVAVLAEQQDRTTSACLPLGCCGCRHHTTTACRGCGQRFATGHSAGNQHKERRHVGACWWKACRFQRLGVSAVIRQPKLRAGRESSMIWPCAVVCSSSACMCMPHMLRPKGGLRGAGRGWSGLWGSQPMRGTSGALSAESKRQRWFGSFFQWIRVLLLVHRQLLPAQRRLTRWAPTGGG